MSTSVMRNSAIIALLSSVTCAIAADPPRLADCAELRDLAPRWKDAVEAFGVPGYAVVVVRGDETLMIETGGFCDADHKRPVTPDTIFYIASCTKPFVALATAELANAGKLDLDAPVKKYLPRFQTADSAMTERITVRDLLCHKPGLNCGEVVFNDAYSGEITEDRYYRLLSHAKPSGSTEYTNVHFTLAGRIVEAISGKSWKDQLATSVFGPLGMTRTTAYASKMYADADVAEPMIWSEGRCVPSPLRKTDRTMHAAGGIGSTARDLGRWLRAFINDGRVDGQQVVPERVVAEMLSYMSKTEPEGRIRHFDGFGLGWRLGTYRERPYVAHQGGYSGAASHISFLPREKIGVAILVNDDGPSGAFIDIASIDVLDKLLGLNEKDLLPAYKERAKQYFEQIATKSSGEPQAKPDLAMSAYAGRFNHEDFGAIEIRAESDRLKVKFGDLRGSLRFTDGATFEFNVTNDMSPKGRFVVDAQQRVTAIEVNLADQGATRFVRAGN